MYESANGHVTVTSQHNALPLDQGTGVRPSGRLPSDRNKPKGSLVTGKPAEEKPQAIRSLLLFFTLGIYVPEGVIIIIII